MKLNKMLRILIIVTVLCPIESMSAQLSIFNAGFESDPLADGEWMSANISGWDIAGEAGAYNPGSSSMPGGITPEGNNMAYVGAGSLTQTLGSVLSANTTYTLTMDVIKRSETQFQSASYIIELLAGENVIAEDNNSLSVASGTYQMSTLLYQALPGDPWLGLDLGIRISGSVHQTNFDRVVLDASSIIATPIPAALPLFASVLGLIGLTGWKRKKTI